MPPPDSLVQIRKITKDYHSLRPLRIESLDLHEGETLALCGFDHMTAEILVDLITAAIVPDSGEIRVFGQLTTAIADRESWLQTLDRFGLLTERAVLVEQFTVEQNLAIPYSLSVEDLSADLQDARGRARRGNRICPVGSPASERCPATARPFASAPRPRPGHEPERPAGRASQRDACR